MLIDSHRFGSVEIPDDRVITMRRPILGFEHLTTFCLIERDELAPFLWLQSTEEADIAFLVKSRNSRSSGSKPWKPTPS